MTEHVVGVSVLGGPFDPRYQARCACGFRGTSTQIRQVAGEQAEAHRQYIAKVAKLAGREP